jgi:amino acid permease
MGKIPYFRVYPLFGGIICQLILFSNFLSKFFNGKQNLVQVFCGQTLFQAIYLEIKPFKSTLAA